MEMGVLKKWGYTVSLIDIGILPGRAAELYVSNLDDSLPLGPT